ncbi:chloride channel protein [Chitinibacter bivalviorum]|uniref:Chloride channel protein n=1 Tax=Chitinibacter bivalviorum TaxID=2739434 RepID=A0A7H9BEU8_9NEIS|nr:chloride channel protein [Chitinibacter bivalviorum]QLG87240.1 chloride channel protein [Chitinibacter bivalviorum]
MFRHVLARFQYLSLRSRQTILLWLGAACVGLVAVLLAKAAEWSFELFNSLQHQWRWAPLMIVPLGGVAARWVMQKMGEGAQGSGIPQTKAALQLTESVSLTEKLLSIRIAIAKFLGIVIGLGSGFVLGREGPTVQIGASIMYALHRFSPKDSAQFRRQLILAGGAAGIAAAFNTPLAGIVFAFEELARSVEEQTSGKLLGAVIIAGVVSLAILGDYVYFGRIHVPNFNYDIILPVIVVSTMCGLVGGSFAWVCIHTKRWLPQAVQIWRGQHPYYFVAACGLLIAIFGLIAPIHGSGAEITSEAINHAQTLPWYFTPLKWAGMILTFMTGLPGGVFAPSLSLGAGVGSWFSVLFSDTSTVKLMAIGMVALLAAVTRAPLTAAVIMMEMTDGHDMVISSLAAAMIASYVSRLFRVNLYHELADSALRALQPKEQDSASPVRAN